MLGKRKINRYKGKENLESYDMNSFTVYGVLSVFLPQFNYEKYVGKAGNTLKETTLRPLRRVLHDFKENKRV